MADVITLKDSEITVWADRSNPRKVMGKVKVNGKQLKTSKTSVIIKAPAVISGKGRVVLTWQ